MKNETTQTIHQTSYLLFNFINQPYKTSKMIDQELNTCFQLIADLELAYQRAKTEEEAEELWLQIEEMKEKRSSIEAMYYHEER